MRGQDLNLRPPGYEPDELPGCSTPRRQGQYTTPASACQPHDRFFFLTISQTTPLDVLRWNFGYTVIPMMIVDILSSVGRFIEFQLTGQSDFRLMVPFDGVRTVNTELEGKLQLDDVKKFLWNEFSIKTRWPVLLEVKAPPPAGWKAGFYHSEGNLGRYQVNKMGSVKSHQVTVRPNLPTPIFRAILGHELVHAFQTENQLLGNNRALREGMARWVEYHFLKNDQPKEAAKLLQMKHFTFGKAVNTIVSYEMEHGRQKTLQWLKDMSLQDNVGG